jgi:hypothetical protein
MIYIPVFVQGVVGSSATSSGVVLIPLMLGWVGSSLVTGQFVTRTGRYRVWPISGTVIVLIGFWLLTRLSVTSGSGDAIVAMVVIGIGMGQMFQTYLLAIQNAVERHELGTATASNQWFRSIGATFGTAVFGTVLNRRLSEELFARLGPAARSIDVQSIGQGTAHGGLSSRAAEAVRASLGAALHSVFVDGMLVMVLALATAFLLKEIPLRTVAHVHGGAELAAELGQASDQGAQDVAEAAVDGHRSDAPEPTSRR